MKKATEKQVRYIKTLFEEVFINPEYVEFEDLDVRKASLLINSLSKIKEKVRPKVNKYDFSVEYAISQIRNAIEKIPLPEEVRKKINDLEYDSIFVLSSETSYWEDIQDIIPVLPDQKGIYIFGIEDGEIKIIATVPEEVITFEVLSALDTIDIYYPRLKELIRKYCPDLVV